MPAAVHWSSRAAGHDDCTAEERWADDAMARVEQTDYELLAGWFDTDRPAYAARRRPIVVLRLDGDRYDSTMTCLEHLFPLGPPNGGRIIIDDYFDWADESGGARLPVAPGCAKRLRTLEAEGFAYVVKPRSRD